MKDIFPFLFLTFFIAIWLIVSLLMAKTGGWSELAKMYQGSKSFDGVFIKNQSAYINFSRYSLSLNLGINSKGLYLIPSFLFRFGHKPIFIPWADISVTRKDKFLWFSWTLIFKKTPDIDFRIANRLAHKINTFSEGKLMVKDE